MNFQSIETQAQEHEDNLNGASEALQKATEKLYSITGDETRTAEWREEQLARLLPVVEAIEGQAEQQSEQAYALVEETRARLAGRTADLLSFDLSESPGLPSLFRDVYSLSTPHELAAYLRDALDSGDRRALHLHALHATAWLRKREEQSELEGTFEIGRLLDQVREAIKSPEQTKLEERMDRLAQRALEVRSAARRRRLEEAMQAGVYTI